WIFKVWFFSSEGPGPGTIDQTDDPQLAYIHFEHRGAPIAVSDEVGEVVWQAHYQPFGEIEELTDVDGNGEVFAFNLRYPGQYHDRESGYYYNYFRDYDPITGRYLQSDPIGLAGGFNTYAYVGGNPLFYYDSDGLNPRRWFLTGRYGFYRFVKEPIRYVKDVWKSCKRTFSKDNKDEPYSPDRDLPKDEYGHKLPESDYPHTQLGRNTSRSGERYRQTREWGAKGDRGYDGMTPKRDVDWTNHNRPSTHPNNPHQHPYNLSTGARYKGGDIPFP
ncbi:MAG: RHS repeat-associated core domain-containing protein, partial [Candidatus Thiodiazotropha sp.]